VVQTKPLLVTDASSPVGNSKSSGTTVPVRVVVIGAGWVAGRYSSSTRVLVLEQALLPGDALPHLNARFTFDVGATQVAGAGTAEFTVFSRNWVTGSDALRLLVQYIYQETRADKRLAQSGGRGTAAAVYR